MGLFFFIFFFQYRWQNVSSIKFADAWIQTADLWIGSNRSRNWATTLIGQFYLHTSGHTGWRLKKSMILPIYLNDLFYSLSRWTWKNRFFWIFLRKFHLQVVRKLFFKNGPSLASFSFIFGLFKQTIEFLQQINVKMSWPSCIQRQDSNPRPLEHK